MSKQVLISLVLVLYSTCIFSSCASTPPPPPPPPIKIWSEEVRLVEKSGEQPDLPQKAEIRYELWTSSTTVPPLSRVEVTLASTGVMADINGSNGEYTISVGQGECKTEWASLTEEMKDQLRERRNQCEGQLDEQAISQLKAAQSLMSIECKGLSGGGVIDLHNMVVSVSKAIQTPAAVEGEKIVYQFPSPIMVNLAQFRCEKGKKKNQYLTQDQLRFERIKILDHAWAVSTKGMKAFGLPELVFLMVEESHLGNAESRLLAAADFILRSEGLQEGQLITSGAAKGMYVKVSRIQQHLQQLAALPSHLAKAMGVVNPEAKVDDLQAVQKVTRRFTLR